MTVQDFTSVYFCLRSFIYLWFSMLFLFNCWTVPQTSSLYCTMYWSRALCWGWCQSGCFVFQRCEAVEEPAWENIRVSFSYLSNGSCLARGVKAYFSSTFGKLQSGRNVLSVWWHIQCYNSVSLGFHFDHELYVWTFYVVKWFNDLFCPGRYLLNPESC